MKANKRKTRKPVAEVAAPISSVRDIAAQLMTIPELAEAFTQADIELALDDRGWQSSTGAYILGDFDTQTRNMLVSKSRLYWKRDPLSHQAVRLWTDYSFGDVALSYQCDDAGVQSKLNKFMKDRRNRNLLSAAGQKKLSNRLLLDGDVFFAMFTDGTIRAFPSTQMTLITDPDDEDIVLAYRRKTKTDKLFYYDNWASGDAELRASKTVKDPETSKTFKTEKNVVVYHLAFDALDKLGNGLLFNNVSWNKEHRRFMEARVGLTQALSKFAWMVTTKGGQAKLSKIQDQIQSTFAKSGLQGGTEKNPQPAPGATLLHNQGMDWTAAPRNTGATDATQDARGLKLMVCAGTGIMEHYFGDPSTGNLATATAMELPMKKQFEGYQKLWKDTYRDLFSIVLDESPDEEPAEIQIDLPAILVDDLQMLGTFLTSVTTAFPEAKVPAVLKMALVSMGVEDIDTVMKDIEAKREELDQQQADMLAAGVVGPPAPAANKKQVAATQESYDRLTKALTELTAKI
jgi:hypothetical protein